MKDWKTFILFLLLLESCYSLCPLNCTCNHDLTNCSHSNLSTTPRDIDPNVINLDLSNNKIIDAKLPNDLQSLQVLNISNNQLVRTNFPKLNVLYEVDLSRNNITHFENVVLTNLKSLKILHLSQNGPFGALRSLVSESLEFLDVSESTITNFDSDFKADLPNLRTLKIRKNNIRSLNQLELKSLTYLDVSDGEISHITSDRLRKLPNLLFLNVSGNEKLRLSLDTHADCHSVENAIFSRISLSSIEISALCMLEEADFSLNSIKEIKGQTFDRNKNLRSLNLSYNHIEVIHENAFGIDNKILHIDLDNNRVANGIWTKPLTNLLSLNISNNKVTDLSDFFLPRLLVLKIYYNEILSIDIDFTTNMPVLEYLDASHNVVEYLPHIKSTSLKTLNLEYCQIQNIPEEAFINLEKLSFLYLEGNKLVRVDYKAFSNAPSLTVISLAHNPWSCNCKSEKFHKLYAYLVVNHTLTNPSELMCSYPLNSTWHDACRKEWTYEEEKSSSLETFLVVLTFFTACLIGMGCVIFIKYRRRRAETRAGRTETTNGPTILPNEVYLPIRRAQSVSEMEHRTSVARLSALPPPSYEEALLLPPLSETERMTRSMDVLAESRMTLPPPPN